MKYSSLMMAQSRNMLRKTQRKVIGYMSCLRSVFVVVVVVVVVVVLVVVVVVVVLVVKGLPTRQYQYYITCMEMYYTIAALNLLQKSYLYYTFQYTF